MNSYCIVTSVLRQSRAEAICILSIANQTPMSITRLGNNKKLIALFFFITCAIFAFPYFTSAIVNSTGYAWGENAGWANFNSTNGGATVSATGVTGYVWLENVGWIQLDYDGVAGAVNTTSTNWGITNDGSGNLGGYAWGENIGWINFHPTDSQVVIDGSGNFSGYAWSENIGWIKFDHAQTSDRPATTWSAVVAPTITISAGSSVESTTATLNGNVTATGGENPTVIVYWGITDGAQTPGSWTNSSTPPTSPAQPQGVAAFYQDATTLSPATTYYFSASANNSAGTSWPAASLSFITKANTPSSLALTVDSATQITAAWSANSNPDGTYYYIENTTNSTNSGWITTRTWASSGLTCNTSYTFTVKAKNGDGVETATSTLSKTTAVCPGGGLPADFYLPPTAPLNGFLVQINNGVTTTNTQDVILTLRGSSDTLRMSISNDINFTNGVQEPYTIQKQWRLTDGQGLKTVYVKFFTAYGVSSSVLTATINYQIPNFITPFINIIIPPTTNPPEIPPIPPLPPVEEAVKPEAPFSMQDIWNLLPTEAINQFVLSPVPQEISDLIEKFPQLSKTLKAIGVSKITDVSKLLDNPLILPNISQITADKGDIPTEIIFVKTGNGLIDYSTTLSLNEQGHPQQQVTTLVNQFVQLIIKPNKPAKAIKGYLVFKQNSMKPAAKIDGSKFTASLLQQEININQALVLSTFDFVNVDNNGIWTADITTPVVDGRYEILTVIDYQDQRLQPKELSMITVVDPEGYVYAQTVEGIEGRIPNAKVSIYWLNPSTGSGQAQKYELWPAKDFQQVNPQITDNTGKYSFLVPEGTYYLKVEAHSYLTYQGNSFIVQKDNGIHQNIELKSKNWLLRVSFWEIIILIILIVGTIFLALNFYKDRKMRIEFKKLKSK